MTGLETRKDPLADLGPNPPRTAEKKARLIEMADFILAARKRRAPLAKIAERLGVSPDYLSQVMAEHHGEAWTIDTGRRPHRGKGKKKGGPRTRVQDQSAEDKARIDAAKAKAEAEARAAAEVEARAKAEAEAEAEGLGRVAKPVSKSANVTDEDPTSYLKRL